MRGHLFVCLDIFYVAPHMKIIYSYEREYYTFVFCYFVLATCKQHNTFVGKGGEKWDMELFITEGLEFQVKRYCVKAKKYTFERVQTSCAKMWSFYKEESPRRSNSKAFFNPFVNNTGDAAWVLRSCWVIFNILVIPFTARQLLL